MLCALTLFVEGFFAAALLILFEKCLQPYWSISVAVTRVLTPSQLVHAYIITPACLSPIQPQALSSDSPHFSILSSAGDCPHAYNSNCDCDCACDFGPCFCSHSQPAYCRGPCMHLQGTTRSLWTGRQPLTRQLMRGRATSTGPMQATISTTLL